MTFSLSLAQLQEELLKQEESPSVPADKVVGKRNLQRARTVGGDLKHEKSGMAGALAGSVESVESLLQQSRYVKKLLFPFAIVTMHIHTTYKDIPDVRT